MKTSNTKSVKWFFNGFFGSIALVMWLEVDTITEGIIRLIQKFNF